jgi:transcriptional regulator with XRE-family HTH domain
MTAIKTARPASGGGTGTVGELLRDWRKRRQLSQLDLALRADVSTRHLSFLETGRSQPTSAMLERLSEQLDIPLRERNLLLLAAGFAPAYPEHRLDEVPMAAVSDAINQVLNAHRPYPAVVVDRHWNLVAANDATDVFLDAVDPRLLEPPANVLRLSLHPDGMAPRIENLGEWRAHLLDRLQHQIQATGDDVLSDLMAELTRYGAPSERTATRSTVLVVPLRFRTPNGVLNLFSTTTVFGSPRDVTVSELAIESFFPADPQTAGQLRAS